MSLKFTWDDEKDEANQKKHSIGFDEALTVFADASACIFGDEWHSTIDEHREIIIGHSLKGRILLVCFTETFQVTIRLISA